jgi:hypothetical protein
MPPPLLISYFFPFFEEIYPNACIQLMQVHITTLNYNVTLNNEVEETNSNTVIAGGAVCWSCRIRSQVSHLLVAKRCQILSDESSYNKRKEQESFSVSVKTA